LVANVPASLKAARLRSLSIGLRRGLPYALAHSRIQTNVTDASTASASTANPLPLKVVVSLIAAAPRALHVSGLPVIAFPVVMLIVHSVRTLSLEREVLRVSIHAVHAARTRHHAAVATSAATAPASHSFAPRVDCAEKRRGCCCKNKNDFYAHRDCPIGGTIVSVHKGRTDRPSEANHKVAVS